MKLQLRDYQEEIIIKCNFCGKKIEKPNKNQKDSFRRRGRAYCCKECGKEYTRKVSSETMSKTNKKYASNRMKHNNPMKNEEIRKKVSQSLKGRKPTVVCGNGRNLTKPQEELLILLKKYNAVPEYAVSTKGYIGEYPMNYKIDIALPQNKIAIEIDGNSHRAIKRKIEDIKKAELLKKKGWKVIRFWNKEVNENIKKCVQKVEVILNDVST